MGARGSGIGQRERVRAVRGVFVSAVIALACACASTDPVRGTTDAGGRDRDTIDGVPVRPDTGRPPTEPPADVFDATDAAPQDSGDADAPPQPADAADTGNPVDAVGDLPPGADVEPDGDDCPGGPACEPDPPEIGCCGVAAPCADRCEPDELLTQRRCSGCEPGAEGVCGGGDRWVCDAASGSRCQEVTCGGDRWYCTEQDGAWAWRPAADCDDLNPCTRADRCQENVCIGESYTCPATACGASRCEGTVFVEPEPACTPTCDGLGGCTPCECRETAKPCGTGAGNACCVATCDPVLGCRTSPGACGGGDVCTDPTTLQIAAQCQGCGAEGAAGVCSAPRVEVCDAASAGLCRQVVCGGLAYTCSNEGGAWRWRTTTGCDDGNPCTHGDACSGGVCAGTAVACVSDACMTRACNGTAVCTQSPRTGSTCDDGNACTTNDVCNASGVCVGGGSAAVCGDGACTCGETNASCPADCPITLPVNACTNGSQNRDRCTNARTISRGSAAAGWASGTQNTCTASNRFQSECGGVFDVGNDHVYALYLQAGERATVTLNRLATRCSSGDDFRARLKLRFNADATAAGATTCPTFDGCFSVSPTTGTYTRTFDATADGWLFMIVDGGASAFNEHRGYYSLNVGLSRCAQPGCGC